jgi:hypothetical protein
MKNDKFDRLLSTIRNEQVDDRVVERASQRVWKSIAGAAPAQDFNALALRSCQDFQALIPGYLDKRLAPARILLFEDHVHACVACRHALDQTREGEKQVVWKLDTKSGASRLWNWVFASAGAMAVACIVVAFNLGMLPGQHPVRASVASVSGALYDVSGPQVHLIPAGYSIGNGDQIRTAKGSRAVVRLEDGSLVEMGERAGLSVSRGWRGTTIRLDGGQVIVQAAKQSSGRHLFVATDDCLISVKGTIFSVNHGIKGSRVAVIEGVVRVNYGERETELSAGEQATSSPNVSKVPIKNEIAWSKDSARYLALLGDFAILQKQIAAIPGPGLRYSSDLLPYVPDNTVVYAAIPNLSNTLGEASRLFHDRLQQSAALRDWYRQQDKGNGPKLDDVLNQLQTFSSYLGDEIVFAAGKTGSDYSAPVVLARVRQPGLETFLQSESARFSGDRSKPALQIVHDPSSITRNPDNPLLVYVDDNLFIASPDPLQLQRAAALAKQGSAGRFVSTPFYQQIAHAYQQGAEWLLCADMEQIVAQNVHATDRNITGMQDVRYLTMEHREVGGKTESQAALSFGSARQGVASWLGSPASMGTLDFVSPDASMVTSAVIKNPRSILDELFKAIAAGDTHFAENLAEFEAKSGVRVLDDIAAPLGGEVTMAFDGPVLPTPRWKLVFEVYDPATLQSTIEKLVESYNRENPNGHSMQLTQQKVGSQIYYLIRGSGKPAVEIDYAFVDNYLIAAPDTSTISRAIQIRQAGFDLPHSSTFEALLPNDGYTNFSAIFYHNIGPVVGPVAEKLKTSGTLTPQQRQSIDALTANSAPGLIYAYGESDRIVVASNTGFMGFDLGTLLTMGHNGPFMPQMLLGGAVTNPSQTQ